MAITIFGGTTIQPLEVNVSASQQQTTFVFLSSDSGSYIYSGSNPDLIFDGTASHHLSSLTFEDSGSIYSFVFSGSGYGTPSPSLPGTTLSASINGLSSSADIAAVFTASVVAATNMTASIISSSIVVLTNSAYSSSAVTTSSFSPGTLGVYTTQVGHPSGYLSGSDTTGSLTVTGSVNINGSLTTTEGFGTDNTRTGINSLTIGTFLTSSADNQLVIGKQNIKGDTTSLFIVGNGGDSLDSAADAFKVRSSGSIQIPTTQSAAPSWSGSNGELIPATVGGNHYLYMSMGDNWVSSPFTGTGGAIIKEASLTIASADVLTLNSTPITIVPAQGAGTVIEVLSAFVSIDFNTTAYATNTFIQLIVNGATTAQYGGGILNATVATTKKLPEISTTSSTTTQLITNAALQVSTLIGNPTAGDSDITVYVTYRIIEL